MRLAPNTGANLAFRRLPKVMKMIMPPKIRP
jgi:hypothetical protein